MGLELKPECCVFGSFWKWIKPHKKFTFTSASLLFFLFLFFFFLHCTYSFPSVTPPPLLFPLLARFSLSLIRCKWIAPHMGDGTRLVSLLIMVCGLAAGNALPICSQRICQMIGVYMPHPPRRVCHGVISNISITHSIPRQTSPQTDPNTCTGHRQKYSWLWVRRT